MSFLASTFKRFAPVFALATQLTTIVPFARAAEPAPPPQAAGLAVVSPVAPAMRVIPEVMPNPISAWPVNMMGKDFPNIPSEIRAIRLSSRIPAVVISVTVGPEETHRTEARAMIKKLDEAFENYRCDEIRDPLVKQGEEDKCSIPHTYEFSVLPGAGPARYSAFINDKPYIYEASVGVNSTGGLIIKEQVSFTGFGLLTSRTLIGKHFFSSFPEVMLEHRRRINANRALSTPLSQKAVDAKPEPASLVPVQ